MEFYIFTHYLLSSLLDIQCISLQRKKNSVKIILGDSMAKVKKTKVSIQARRRLFFLRPICLFLLFFVAITFISNTIRLYQLNNERKRKEDEYIKQQEKSDYLKNEIVKLNDPEYLAKFARENYSYSKDGELIIKLDEKDDEEVKVEDNIKDSNKEWLIYCGIGVALVIFYLFMRMLRKRSVN